MKYLLLLLIIFSSIAGMAQEKNFIFIQTENRQPFYVSLNGKNYSSTASGYVIIPQLKVGAYDFRIGFAKNEIPEQSFSYNVQRNVGLALKNFGDQGWGLFNLQTLAVTMAGTIKSADVAYVQPPAAVEKPISFDVKKESVPAAVATEVAITNTEVSKDQVAETPKPELPTADNANKATEIPSSTITKESPPAGLVAKNPATVNKVSENNTSNGVALVYTDKSGKQTDTIDIIIPPAYQTNPTAVSENKKVEESPVQATASTTIEKDPRFLDVGTSQSKKQNSTTEDKVSIASNSSCQSMATEDDYTKLRRKMARESTDDDMLKEAKKVYRNKCFTTAQVQALSSLFLSDESRLVFFQNSLNFVSDPENFQKLEAEFVSPEYVTQFKSLLNK